MIDWSTCPEVERSPERVGGAWTFRGTRLPVAALFDNLAAGATVPEFLEWFPGATPGQVDAVLAHASRSAGAGLAATKASGPKLRVRPASDDGPPRPGPIPSARDAVGSDTSGSVISRDPEVMGGTPAFAGTRMPIVEDEPPGA